MRFIQCEKCWECFGTEADLNFHFRGRIHQRSCTLSVDGHKLDFERERDGNFYCVCDNGFGDIRSLRKHVLNCFRVVSNLREGKGPTLRTVQKVVGISVTVNRISSRFADHSVKNESPLKTAVAFDDGQDDTVSESSQADEADELAESSDASEDEVVIMEGSVFYVNRLKFNGDADYQTQLTSDSDIKTMGSCESGKCFFLKLSGLWSP